MKKLLMSFMLLLMVVPAIGLAAEFKTGETSVSLEKKETAKNLYIASQTVNVDGNVTKDLIAAGNSVNVNGNVQNSLIAAGNSLTVKGNIGDNVRTASNNIVIQGNVGGDITSVGQSLVIEKTSTVTGDVMVGGGTLEINGKVAGNVYFGGTKLTINGLVGGNIKTSVRNVVIGDNAKIGGKLIYWSQNKATIADENNIKGGVDFKKQQNVNLNFSFKGFWFFSLVMKSIMLFVVLLIFVYLMPRFAKNYVNETYKNVWKNLGWGAFTLFLVPAIAVLLLVTFVGAPIGVVLGLLYVLTLISAGVLVPLAVGSLIMKLVDKKAKEYVVGWKIVLIGVLAVFVLQLIPIVGGLAMFVFFLFSLGELALTGWGVFKRQRA